MEWEIDRRRAVMKRGTNSQNFQIFKSLSRSLFLSAAAPQISVTKWTYNWKSGGPEILFTFSLSRLDISSGELQGWYEHMGRRWGKEKVIRRSPLLVCKGLSLPDFFFTFCFCVCFLFADTHTHTHTFPCPSFSLNVSHYGQSPHICHIGQSPVMISQGSGALCTCYCVFIQWFLRQWLGFSQHPCEIPLTPTHTALTGSQKVLFSSESLFLPCGCWKSPIVWTE